MNRRAKKRRLSPQARATQAGKRARRAAAAAEQATTLAATAAARRTRVVSPRKNLVFGVVILVWLTLALWQLVTGNTLRALYAGSMALTFGSVALLLTRPVSAK